MSNEYEIIPTKGNINAYNRYPFKDFSDAVNNINSKSIQPGEIAFAYYYDPAATNGINVLLGVGSLKKFGNIIFLNSADVERLYNDVNDKVMNQNNAINRCIDLVNNSYGDYKTIKKELAEILIYLNDVRESLKDIEWIDIDEYNDDIQ